MTRLYHCELSFVMFSEQEKEALFFVVCIVSISLSLDWQSLCCCIVLVECIVLLLAERASFRTHLLPTSSRAVRRCGVVHIIIIYYYYLLPYPYHAITKFQITSYYL